MLLQIFIEFSQIHVIIPSLACLHFQFQFLKLAELAQCGCLPSLQLLHLLFLDHDALPVQAANAVPELIHILCLALNTNNTCTDYGIWYVYIISLYLRTIPKKQQLKITLITTLA